MRHPPSHTEEYSKTSWSGHPNFFRDEYGLDPPVTDDEARPPRFAHPSDKHGLVISCLAYVGCISIHLAVRFGLMGLIFFQALCGEGEVRLGWVALR